MGWIIHVDMNSYFASVEQQRNPYLRGKAIGVGGKPGTRGVITSPSREAKQRGVTTGLSSWEALKLCPELIIIEPDYDLYRQTSERMFGILERYSPDVEIFSIDEAFVGIGESSWDIERVIGITQSMKRDFLRELGSILTASIGIAHNKRLAKLASESQKPNGLTILLEESERETVQELQKKGMNAWTRPNLFAVTPIAALSGIGRKLDRRLRAIGIHTLGDLSTRSVDELRSAVFPYERELYLIGQGRDMSRLVPYWAARPEQSIGHQYTLPRDIAITDLAPVLMYLTEKVGCRLRRGGWVARHLTVYLRQTNGPGWSAATSTTTQIESDHDIFERAWRLIEQACANPHDPLARQTLIRMPSLTVSRLAQRAAASQSIFKDQERAPHLTRAIDVIRARFGDRAITSGLSRRVSLHTVPDGRRKRFTPTP